jgi:hypothetical protein
VEMSEESAELANRVSGVWRVVNWGRGSGSSVASLDPSRWSRYVVPKRPFLTNLRCVTFQKKEYFRLTAVKAYILTH